MPLAWQAQHLVRLTAVPLACAVGAAVVAVAAGPAVAHDEVAVAVDDSRVLVTWSFRPPAARRGPDTRRSPRPRPPHAAKIIAHAPFDPLDTARAADQLAAAKERAAELEQPRADRALRILQGIEDQRVLGVETASTARALRGATGQDR